MALSCPYCTSADVGILLPHLLRGASDFSANTQPTKVVVDTLIGWVSAEIERAFAAVGFIVPLQPIDGEEWDDSTTQLLTMMTAIGVAGLIVGPVIKPAPAMGRDSATADNNFTETYKRFLRSIYENGAGVRAAYRTGTRAEQFCITPGAPQIAEDYVGAQLETTGEYTERIERLRRIYARAADDTV